MSIPEFHINWNLSKWCHSILRKIIFSVVLSINGVEKAKPLMLVPAHHVTGFRRASWNSQILWCAASLSGRGCPWCDAGFKLATRCWNNQILAQEFAISSTQASVLQFFPVNSAITGAESLDQFRWFSSNQLIMNVISFGDFWPTGLTRHYHKCVICSSNFIWYWYLSMLLHHPLFRRDTKSNCQLWFMTESDCHTVSCSICRHP